MPAMPRVAIVSSRIASVIVKMPLAFVSSVRISVFWSFDSSDLLLDVEVVVLPYLLAASSAPASGSLSESFQPLMSPIIAALSFSLSLSSVSLWTIEICDTSG